MAVVWFMMRCVTIIPTVTAQEDDGNKVQENKTVRFSLYTNLI